MDLAKKSLVSVATALSLAVGCAHAPPQTAPTTETETKPSKPQMIATPEKPADATAQELAAHKDLTAAAQDLKDHTRVFFNFDDFTLNDDGKQALTKIGDILAKNPRLSIRVEGNCDERGTEDYNLALGQKRADAAKTYLTALGAKDNQVTTVSYGAERPVSNGHEEGAWKQNRRDDVIVADPNSQAQAQ